MNKFAFVFASLIMASVSAHAADLNYDCGYYSVVVHSQKSVSATDNAEWGENYVLSVEGAKSSKFGFADPANADADLAANQVVVSQTLLDGQASGYVLFIGGESAGKYGCKLAQ